MPTSFKDGPAKGQNLMLKRAPIYLRVVEEAGKWDALDQPTDEPSAGEKVYAYKITGAPGHCHINARGGRGGFYTIAEYAICTTQPTEAEMRSRAKWTAWCESMNAQDTTMTDDERIIAHFNENAKPCRSSTDKPRLIYEAGCWTINCRDGCRCQISDGDHTSPTPILTRWKQGR